MEPTRKKELLEREHYRLSDDAKEDRRMREGRGGRGPKDAPPWAARCFVTLENVFRFGKPRDTSQREWRDYRRSFKDGA